MIKVVVIHGGDSFNTYQEYLQWLEQVPFRVRSVKSWKNWLVDTLDPHAYEVLLLDMPNKQNAQYHEWKIMFEKVRPGLDDKSILIGHSLGGIFLAKYLAENDLKVKALHLVAAPFERVGSFELPKVLLRLNQNCEKIVVWHSVEDEVVPFGDSEKYVSQLPKAQHMKFINKGHFNQEEFPELVDAITNV